MKPKPEYFEAFFYVEAMHHRGPSFPLDMLRYDSCTFATEHDAQLAAQYLEPGNTACKAIKLRRFHKNGAPAIPGEARWLSFGWRILSSRDTATMDDIRREGGVR